MGGVVWVACQGFLVREARGDVLVDGAVFLSCLDLGRAQNAGPTESAPLRTTQVPEPERLGPGRSAQGRPLIVPAEQSRARTVWAGRLHAP